MTLADALRDKRPGTIIYHGEKDSSDFVEIFVLADCSLRFSDELMTIDSNLLSSDKWEIK